MGNLLHPITFAILQDIPDKPNVSMLDLVGAREDEDGGDSWSTQTCRASVKSSPPTNQHPAYLLQAGCPSCRPTNGIRALNEKYRMGGVAHPNLTWDLLTFSLTTKDSC